MMTAHDAKQKAHRGPHVAVECSWPSEVTAISPYADKLMLFYSGIAAVFLKA
jgi:hypothetical protein